MAPDFGNWIFRGTFFELKSSVTFSESSADVGCSEASWAGRRRALVMLWSKSEIIFWFSTKNWLRYQGEEQERETPSLIVGDKDTDANVAEDETFHNEGNHLKDINFSLYLLSFWLSHMEKVFCVCLWLIWQIIVRVMRLSDSAEEYCYDSRQSAYFCDKERYVRDEHEEGALQQRVLGNEGHFREERVSAANYESEHQRAEEYTPESGDSTSDVLKSDGFVGGREVLDYSETIPLCYLFLNRFYILWQHNSHRIVQRALPKYEGEQVGFHIHIVENRDDCHWKTCSFWARFNFFPITRVRCRNESSKKEKLFEWVTHLEDCSEDKHQTSERSVCWLCSCPQCILTLCRNTK